MLTCKEVSQLVSESLDRKLPLRQRIAVRLHLFRCKICTQYREQMLFLRKAARQYAKKTEEATGLPDASLSSEARLRMKQLMNEHASNQSEE